LYRLVYIIFTYGLFDTIAGSLAAAMGQMLTGDQVTNQDWLRTVAVAAESRHNRRGGQFTPVG